MANLFERLGRQRPPVPAPANKQLRRSTDVDAFLVTLLLHGPVLATTIEQHGKAQGFTHRQLTRAKERMKILSLREVGPAYGKWLWALPGHASPKAGIVVLANQADLEVPRTDTPVVNLRAHPQGSAPSGL